MLEVLGKDFPGEVGDAALIGEGQAAPQVRQRNPGHVHRLVVRIIFDGEVAAAGFEQEMVHGFVDAVAAHGEPVVNTAQRSQDAAVDSGLLGNLADRGRLVVFTVFRMAFRQAPFKAAAAVEAGDDGNPLFLGGGVHDDSACGHFLDGGKGRMHRVRAGATH